MDAAGQPMNPQWWQLVPVVTVIASLVVTIVMCIVSMARGVATKGDVDGAIKEAKEHIRDDIDDVKDRVRENRQEIKEVASILGDMRSDLAHISGRQKERDVQSSRFGSTGKGKSFSTPTDGDDAVH